MEGLGLNCESEIWSGPASRGAGLWKVMSLMEMSEHKTTSTHQGRSCKINCDGIAF